MIDQLHCPSNNSVLSLPLTQKFCVAMVKQLKTAFSQGCTSCPAGRHRVWDPLPLERIHRWPCRVELSSSSGQTGKNVITLSCALNSGLFRESLIFMHLLLKIGLLSQFSVCPVKERYLHLLPSILSVINKTPLLFTMCAITLQIFNIPGYA